MSHADTEDQLVDKATALKVHDKVWKHWQAELVRVRQELARYNLPAAEKPALKQRLEVLETTDMALIVSPGQNEIEQMKGHGLDIVRHRKRMNDEELDEKFKDSKKLVEELRKAADAATFFCANRGVILPAIEQLPAGSMKRLERIGDAVEALIAPDASIYATAA